MSAQPLLMPRSCKRIVFLLTMMVGMVFLLRYEVRAAALTSVRDIMTRQIISVASNHEIRFVTPTGVESSTDTIAITFATGFDLSAIGANDILFTHGPTTGFETSETLATVPATGVWGVSSSGQTLTFTAPTNAASGEIAGNDLVIVRIGTAAGTGADRITNPPSLGMYSVSIGGTFGDTGVLTIPITNNDALMVTVTIPAASGGGGGGSGGNGGGGAATISPPSLPSPQTPLVPTPTPVFEPPLPSLQPPAPSSPRPPTLDTLPSPTPPRLAPIPTPTPNAPPVLRPSLPAPIPPSPESERSRRDVTPPSNPTDMQAVGQDHQIALVWTNPRTPDFAEIVVVVRTDRYPLHPTDGRIVYTGRLNTTIDTGLMSGQTYFYSIFARDQAGNVSSGGALIFSSTLPASFENIHSPLFSSSTITSSTPFLVTQRTLTREPSFVAAVSREIVGRVVEYASVIHDVARKTVASPVVQETNREVVAPVIVAAAVTNLTMAASVTRVFHYAYFLFTQPLLLFGRKRRKQWGVVYDALAKRPVDLAIVRLLDTASDRVLQTRITDSQGRYAFSVRPGTYRLQAIKQGFVFPTQYLKDEKEDGTFVDIYHGESIQIKDHTVLTLNLPLDPPERKEESLAQMIRKRRLHTGQQVISLFGVFWSAVSLAVSPTWTVFLLFAIQLWMYGFFFRLAMPTKPKNWGLVYESDSRAQVPQAVVRIFDSKFHKLLETQLTDARGRYAFLVGQSVYEVKAEKKGYEGFASSVIDYRGKTEQIIAEKIGLVRAN